MARQVSPGFGGAVSDAVEAVKGYMAAGRRETDDASANRDEQGQLQQENNSSSVASNPGRAAQSTDASNQY
jgi:hypothetical protein